MGVAEEEEGRQSHKHANQHHCHVILASAEETKYFSHMLYNRAYILIHFHSIIFFKLIILQPLLITLVLSYM